MLNVFNRAFLQAKKRAILALNKRGYSKTNNFYIQRYKDAVREIEIIYKKFVLKNCILSDNSRLDLIANLDGTELSEAIYLLNYLNESMEISGDVCEFGVAGGATSALMANEIAKTDKNIWLFDTFTGLPKPTEQDKLISADDFFNYGSIEKYAGSMAHSADQVLNRLKEINFSSARTKVITGLIEETIKLPNVPAKVSFAYVDTDLYLSVSVILNFLDFTLQPGGYVIIDDYDHFCTGPKLAVDDFLSKNENMNRYELILPPEQLKKISYFCVLRKNKL